MKIKPRDLIFVIVYSLLVLFQIKTTNIKSAYSPTPAEVDFQIQRMNMFPPFAARVGYIMEVKKEVRILEKLQNNFFTVVDFKEYFPNRLPYVFAPFILIGLYFFVRDWQKHKLVFFSFLFSIALLAIIGSHAKYGPVLMYPYFILFVIVCLKKVF